MQLSDNDVHLLLDVAVAVFTALSAWQASRTKLEITRLKLWIAQNFVSKKDANLIAD